MAVEHITIRKKKYPIKIGYFVMKTIKQETKADSLKQAFEDARDNENLEVFESILFAALKQGAWDEEEELDIKRDQMPLVLGNCFAEFMKKFASGKFFPKDIEDAAAEIEGVDEGKEETGELKRKK